MYKRQGFNDQDELHILNAQHVRAPADGKVRRVLDVGCSICLLYTSDAADERSSVDLGGRRIIKKKRQTKTSRRTESINKIITYKARVHQHNGETAKAELTEIV